MTKYQPIAEELRHHSSFEWQVSFDGIERILGFKLPSSAREHRAWWANNPANHPHSRAWLEAGWKTENVDMAAERVTFRRVREAGTGGRSGEARPLYGGLKGTVHIPSGVDLTAPTGEIWNADQGDSE